MTKLIVAIVACAGVPVILLSWAFQSPVPISRLELLRKGMSQQEVRAILGDPTQEYGQGQWTYKKPFVFGFVNIHWQGDSTYIGEYNFERF